MNRCLFSLDDAWSFAQPHQFGDCPVYYVEEEAKALRFITNRSTVQSFTQKHRQNFRPFTLYGSGDFHHLSAVWLTQFDEPFTLISFDNHPDWDIRPPHWSCGAWINRVLENPRVEQVQIWGCANFECNFPWRLLGNRKACRAGKLQVHPWQKPGHTYADYLHPIEPGCWLASFAAAVEKLAGQAVYLTIDLDVLASAYSLTNWEAGQLSFAELVESVRLLKARTRVIGGDICGAYSTQRYASTFQKLAGAFDHPHVKPVSDADKAQANGEVLRVLWPLLTGG